MTFSIALFYFHSLNLISNEESSSERFADDSDIIYDTSIKGNDDESWYSSRADLLLTLIRRATTELPYVGTSSNIGPGKILYATACSLVLAGIFLPSSHFHPSKKEQKAADDIIAMGPDQYSKQNMLSDMDKRYQGKDKRFVVALARNTHTWRVFPLPTRSHALISQHTLKEQLNIVGTLQLYFDGRHFNMHKFKFGRGAIYKGKYIPVFCVEIACWLLEASWQAYYSSTEYSLSDWAPGRMRLDQIGLKLERNITDSETDTHVFVATNISEQVEGEEDSIIVVCFRGSASRTNIKTDLSFKQVPLPEKIKSDVPAFNIRPGMPIAVDETLWDEQASSSLPSVLQDIIHGPSGHYKSWPTTGEETDYSSTNACHPVDLDQSVFIPTVSNAGKAIIRATPMARQALPCVHEGFLQNYTKIRHELVETILSILKRQLEKSVKRSHHSNNRYSDDDDGDQPLTLPKIYITGHSMGGALGQLLALDLASNCEIVIEQALPNDKGINGGSGNHSRQSLSSFDNDDDMIEEAAGLSDLNWLGQRLDDPNSSSTKISKKKIRLRPPIAVYSYGQPRLGNNAFKTIYKKRVPHTFRVCTEGDAITTMPSTGPFFGGIYRHAGLEVLLEEGCTGNILVGPTVVETLLRFSKVRTSLDAHSLERYRESLESALGREDLKEYYRGHGGKVRHNNQDGNGYLSGNSGPLPSWVTSVKRHDDNA